MLEILKKKDSGDDESPSTFEGVIQALDNVVGGDVKHKRDASKRARLKVIQSQADRAEGKHLDMSRDQQQSQIGLEAARESAFAIGGLDAVDLEIKARKLAVRRLADILPSERARAAEARKKANAACRESDAAEDRAHRVAMRLGDEQTKIEKLEREERPAYQRLAERVGRGEHPVLWRGAGDPPQRQHGVPYVWQDFTRLYSKNGMIGFHDIDEGRVSIAELKRRAEEANRIAKEEEEKQYRDACEIARLRISPRELPLLREDHSPEAA